MSVALDRGNIEALLGALDAELARRGARADLFLVGGAAIALAYDARRATRDLGAAFKPTAVVREAALAVASSHGLSEDWLNDAVKASCPGPTRRRSATSPVKCSTSTSPPRATCSR